MDHPEPVGARDGPESPSSPEGADPSPRKGLRLKARWRLARATVRTLLWVVLGLALLLVGLVRTAVGHRVVLAWGLDQLRSRVAGSVEVDEIRSADLLDGARLVGVRLATPEGDTFVEADSLEVTYSIRGLLTGVLAFQDVHLWNPRVVLERDSAGTDTFDRWLRGDRAPEPGGGGGGPSVLLEDVRIDGGTFSLRMAGDVDPQGLFRTEPGPLGDHRRAMDFRSLEGRLPRIELSPEIGVEVEIARSSGELDLLARRFELAELQAHVSVKDGVVAADVRRLAGPGIAGAGLVEVAPADAGEGTVTDIDATLDEADLREWAWVMDGVPPLVGSLALRGRLGPGEQRWTAYDVDARWEGGRVQGRGTAILDGRTALDDVDLRVASIPLDALDPYLPRDPGVDGTLTGRVALSGPVDRLQLSGEVTLDGAVHTPVGAAFEGGVRRAAAGGVGFQAFHLVLDPLDWTLVGRVFPEVKLTGPGRLEVEATGSLGEGLAVQADLSHAPPGTAASHLLLQGNVFAAGDDRIRVDVQGDLAPLSLDALARDYGELPLSGTLTGPARARGVLRDLEVRANLLTPEGTVDLTGRVDLRQPGERYEVDARVTDFLASALAPSLPSPTRITGRVQLAGRGVDLSTLEASGLVDIQRADVRGVRVDSARAVARIADGVVVLDTVAAAVAGLDLQGEGTLAADSTRPAGRIRLAFQGDDLTGIRAVFRGDTVLTADDLTPLDRDVLVLRGVDPDTLPLAADVAAEGRLRGEFVLDGSISAFTASGWVEGEGLRYGRASARGGRLDLQARDLPGLAGALRADLTLDSAVVADREFTTGSVSLDYTRPRGWAVVTLARDSTEDYRLTGRFELDSLGGTVDLEEATMRVDSLAYRTAHASRITWTDSVFAVDSLRLVGSGAEPVGIRAAGVLPRRGAADFDLEVLNLDLRRLLQVAQREDLEWSGHVDFTGSVRGTAAHPTLSGEIATRDLVARNLSLERLEGTVSYADGEVDMGLDAWARGLRVLRVEGTWPYAFALDGSTRDVSDRSVDLAVRADSLPAGLVLSLLEDLENTQGTISGTLDVAGTPAALEPRGLLRLDDGAWTVGALGVRQEQVQATFDVQADRIVQVQASGRSGGTVNVTGTVTLDSLASPALDLDVALQSFNAVDRRDISGAVSGDLQLQGRYGQPRVLGSLQVERGDLFLDEFARNVGVVDLTDPRFFAFIGEDLLASRPLLAETRNPFMDNLLVAIDLGVQRNTWLRSDQLDVEMRGDLIVTYDRPNRDVVMVGELQAVRGQYQFLGQNFEVQGGTVEFVGIPGINPDLDIQALARVRRRQGAEPLEITAQVGGTLIEPRVEFTTPDAAVSQSDILSYIAVGQPASSITSDVGAAAGGLVGGFVGGTLTSSLATLAQGSGWIDFVSISQAFDASAVGVGAQGLGQSFSGTQIEVGTYLGTDYFAAFSFRPLAGTGSAGTGAVFGGARIEWQASAQYLLELFAEDRFFRTGSFGFRAADIESRLIFGFSLFREWGY